MVWPFSNDDEKKKKKPGFQKMIDASPARRMLQEMETGTQDAARARGTSTDEESRRRRQERMRGK